MKEKKAILQFLKQNVLATISTVSKETSKPESALIAYLELPTLELIFITRKDSRKFENLLKNPHVALVIGWDIKKWKTLQYEGDALQVEEKEVSKCRNLFVKKPNTPCTEEFLSNPEMVFFKIKPTWIGFSDFTGKKPHVIEINRFYGNKS